MAELKKSIENPKKNKPLIEDGAGMKKLDEQKSDEIKKGLNDFQRGTYKLIISKSPKEGKLEQGRKITLSEKGLHFWKSHGYEFKNA